jgi:outer membrane receptor protein involved in Fe transport
MFQRIAATLAATIVFAGLAMGQIPTGSIVGRVTDATHAPVPGANIKVRDVNTNLTRTAQSQADGEYTVSNLSPGTYEVAIDKAGFRQVHESALELQIDQVARIDATLVVGTVSESVEIKADTPLLNTENFTRGDLIGAKELTEMPLNGRDFDDLAFLVPGVQPAEQSAKGAPYVANGARADASAVFLDGQNDESPRDAGPQVKPPLDSIQEFKFETSGYSAQYGRLAGGVVTMNLKSGTNELHGALFEFVRNNYWDARNFFDGAQTSELRRNQFGGSLLGPVIIPKLYNGRNKTFFMFSWESYRQVQGSNSIGVVPSALEQQGIFSQDYSATGTLIRIKDPLASGSCTATSTAGCFPGNIIPASRIDPIAAKIAQYYPAPNLTGANNFIANYSTPDNWDSYAFKVDQRLSSKDNFSFRLLFRHENSDNPYSGSPLGTFGAGTISSNELYGLSETHIFTPSVVNEFHFGLTRTVSNELSAHAGTNYAGQLGIPGTSSDPTVDGFPKFTVTGYETFGDNASDPIRYTVNDFDVSNALTWVKGRHTFKFGGDVLRVQYYQPTNSNFNGTFAFNGKATGDGFADLLLGALSSTSRKIGTVTNHLFDTNYAAFVQDDWKILPSLTLNLGLRYEIQGAPYEEFGQLSSYVPGINKLVIGGTATVPNWQATVASAGLTGVIVPASTVGIPAALSHTNYDNFGPRVGFAWRPFGDNKTVIRSGYGIFYTGSRLSAERTDIAGGFPFSLSQSFTGSATNLSLVTLENPFPAALAKVTGTTTASGYELNPPSPYLQSWNFTIERELVKGFVLETSYTGSKGTHLGRKYDLNQEIRTPTSTTRPYSGFSEIDYYTFSQNSSYEAGTVTLKKNYAHAVFLRANYTRGKSIDTNSGLNYAGAGGYQGAQNSLDLGAERGLSDFDVRNVFSLSLIWRPMASSATAYSGQPFTPYVSGSTADLAQATRPNRLSNGSLSNPTPTDWFNVAAFVAVPDSAYAYGNSGRNILEGPGTLAINLSLSREFKLRERNRLQLRWEVFNATNHTNFNLPNDAIDKANAGTITGNKPARIMQIGMRYAF